jgi:hypothetical protein
MSDGASFTLGAIGIAPKALRDAFAGELKEYLFTEGDLVRMESIDVTKPERWILRCQRLKKENRRRTPARPWER